MHPVLAFLPSGTRNQLTAGPLLATDSTVGTAVHEPRTGAGVHSPTGAHCLMLFERRAASRICSVRNPSVNMAGWMILVIPVVVAYRSDEVLDEAVPGGWSRSAGGANLSTAAICSSTGSRRRVVPNYHSAGIGDPKRALISNDDRDPLAFANGDAQAALAEMPPESSAMCMERPPSMKKSLSCLIVVQ